MASAGIPSFEFPDVACRVFNHMWQYSSNLETLYEVPTMSDMITEVPLDKREAAKALIQQARKTGRSLLTEIESKELLNLYGIPTTEMIVASTEDEAVAAATKIGYPVVIKIHSETITHKTEVGGVRLNLDDEKDVRSAFRQMQSNVPSPADFLGVTVQPMVKLPDSYEVIFGSSTDAQVGKTVVFGHGGQFVEIFKDTCLGLPPLTGTLAKNMIQSTRIYKALNGFRGKPKVNMPLLESLLVRFSQLVTDLNSYIQEIDVNPLVVSHAGVVALDARVLIYPNEKSKVPRPAVREYPIEYVTTEALNDEETVRIRPIKIEDHVGLVGFFDRISQTMKASAENEIALRYLQAFYKIAQQYRETSTSERSLESSKAKGVLFKDSKKIWDMLVRLCIGHYDSEIVLIAEPDSSNHILALAMFTRLTNEPTIAEMSIVVGELYQQKKLGTRLVQQLIHAAKAEGFEILRARISKNNVNMKKLCEKLGFEMQETKTEVIATLHIY